MDSDTHEPECRQVQVERSGTVILEYHTHTSLFGSFHPASAVATAGLDIVTGFDMAETALRIWTKLVTAASSGSISPSLTNVMAASTTWLSAEGRDASSCSRNST